jgi:hypothetical protein
MQLKRLNRRSNQSDDFSDNNNSNKKSKNHRFFGNTRRLSNDKKAVVKQSRIMVGLTLTVGVAAVAMYAVHTSAREPQELISRFFHILNYN